MSALGKGSRILLQEAQHVAFQARIPWEVISKHMREDKESRRCGDIERDGYMDEPLFWEAVSCVATARQLEKALDARDAQNAEKR